MPNEYLFKAYLGDYVCTVVIELKVRGHGRVPQSDKVKISVH